MLGAEAGVGWRGGEIVVTGEGEGAGEIGGEGEGFVAGGKGSVSGAGTGLIGGNVDSGLGGGNQNKVSICTKGGSCDSSLRAKRLSMVAA